MSNKRFIIAAGGTGGHFYPGFSLGKLLNKQGCSVLFVVRRADVAARVLKEQKLKYQEIDFCALPRSLNPWKYVQFIRKFYTAFGQTRAIVKQFKPDVAVGMGSYISFVLLLVARLEGIKTAAHDSNTKIGLANKLCSHFTNLFMLGLPVREKIRHSVLVGTPIRKEFADPVNKSKVLKDLGLNPEYKTVLLFGGSQGARALNLALVETVKRLVAENEKLQFIHISGDRWYQSLLHNYGKVNRVQVLPYANEIYDLIHSCDLVVCRSGAGTLAELVYCKKPSVLVPLPTAAANHQYYNAKILQSVGCASLVQEGEHLPERLHVALDRLLTSANNAALQTMQENFAKLNLPNPLTASECIAEMLKNL